MKSQNKMRVGFAVLGVAITSVSAEDLYYSATGPGYYPWGHVAGWIIYNSGGTPYGKLPSTNDNVRINATSTRAEDGHALTVTNGVFAECAMFATGDQNYPGTAWFRLDGGSLTCATHFVIGRYYPGLGTLESGALYCASNLYVSSNGGVGVLTNNGATVEANQLVVANNAAPARSALVQHGGSLLLRSDATIGYRGDAWVEINGGDVSIARTCTVGRVSGSSGTLMLNGGSITGKNYVVVGEAGQGTAVLSGGSLGMTGDFRIGNVAGGSGTVTNAGAAITAANIHVGYQAGAFGRLVHTGGSLSAGNYLQVGRNGGVGEFEADAPFSAAQMIIGTGLAPTVPGTGTVTLAENAVGTVDEFLRVNNGDLFMRGGQVYLRNVGNPTTPPRTNLYVRTGEDRRGQLRGWGYVGYTNESITLRMINNGPIVADGEGEERDLDFNMIAVVNNDIPNGASGTNGWYAVNRGRLRYPRTWQTYSPGAPYCWGDLYTKAVPEMVNSVGFAFTASVNAAIRGALYAPGRSDIPAGLPARMRLLGVWQIGAFAGKVLLTKASFSGISLTFRYDHAQLKPKDSSLRLFRYTGSAWVQVGSATPGGDPLISSDMPLAPVSSGDYNIGWFAVMAVERNGTLISVY